ncbi:MAG: hypothetical protein HGA25_08365 [Clostridiales bacterium]|nr:hypothetical protein [Clostridiales bacterium]
MKNETYIAMSFEYGNSNTVLDLNYESVDGKYEVKELEGVHLDIRKDSFTITTNSRRWKIEPREHRFSRKGETTSPLCISEIRRGKCNHIYFDSDVLIIILSRSFLCAYKNKLRTFHVSNNVSDLKRIGTTIVGMCKKRKGVYAHLCDTTPCQICVCAHSTDHYNIVLPDETPQPTILNIADKLSTSKIYKLGLVDEDCTLVGENNVPIFLQPGIAPYMLNLDVRDMDSFGSYWSQIANTDIWISHSAHVIKKFTKSGVTHIIHAHFHIMGANYAKHIIVVMDRFKFNSVTNNTQKTCDKRLLAERGGHTVELINGDWYANGILLHIPRAIKVSKAQHSKSYTTIPYSDIDQERGNVVIFWGKNAETPAKLSKEQFKEQSKEKELYTPDSKPSSQRT